MNLNVFLALADFIPVILYIISMLFITEALKNLKQSGPLNLLLKICAVFIFLSGLLKASAKLMTATGRSFEPLTTLTESWYFPVLVTLYFIAGASVFISVILRKKPPVPVTAGICLILLFVLFKTLVSFPSYSSSAFIFISVLMLGNLLLWGSLAFISFKNRMRSAGVMFILTFIFLMVMGRLNSMDFTEVSSHIAAESVNTAAQIFMLTAASLFRKGVKNMIA